MSLCVIYLYRFGIGGNVFPGLHSFIDMCMSGIVVDGGINIGSIFISYENCVKISCW